MKTLILLSGGLDSTTCLLQLMSKTDDEVVGLAIDVDNNEDKGWCESKSISTVLEQTNEIYRETKLETSKILIKGTASNMGQPPVWLLFAAFMADKHKVDRVCIGYTKGDNALEDANMKIIEKGWKAMWDMVSETKKRPKLWLPLKEQSKKQSLAYLKKLEKRHKNLDVIKHLWTCEMPVVVVSTNMTGFVPCKECLPCKRGLEIGFVQK